MLYDLDFSSSSHTVGSPPVTGAGTAPRTTVWSINFGTPTVVSTFGVLTDQPLEFNAFDGQGDQIQLSLADLPAGSAYVLAAQIVVGEIAARGYFRVFVDTPEFRSISFNSDGTVKALVHDGSSSTIGTFGFGEKIDLKVEVDLSADHWNVYPDGVSVLSADFGGATRITAIRVTTDVLPSPPGSRAAIDNVWVIVSSAPVPK